MIKKYSVLLCLVASVLCIVVASLLYPGGSLLNKNSVGFGWSENFLSNLFETKAINGLENPGRIWALVGTAFHAIGYGFFFIHMSKKIPLQLWATILKCIGYANLLLIFLIATPLHDVGTLSIIFTLVGLFVITIFIVKAKLYLLTFFCVICLLTFYCFFFFFGFGYLGLAILFQKVYVISATLLVLVLEHATQAEHFHSQTQAAIKVSEQKIS